VYLLYPHGSDCGLIPARSSAVIFHRQTLADMLSVKSLLNPAPPRPSRVSQRRSSIVTSSPVPSYPNKTRAQALSKMPRPSAPLVKSQPRGEVRYWPFESFDEQSLAEIKRFRVNPSDKFYESCAHIPYNSGKKDFSCKTGRESLEGIKTSLSVLVRVCH